MVNQRLLGWVLLAAGLILLNASGGLALSAILAPLSILLAYAILSGGNRKQQAASPREKEIV